jgi:hypothetical protein
MRPRGPAPTKSWKPAILAACSLVFSGALAGSNPSAISAQGFGSDRLSIAPTLGAVQPVGYFGAYFDPKLGAGVRMAYTLNSEVALVLNGRLDMYGGGWLYYRHPTFENRAPDLRSLLLGVGVERLVVEPEGEGLSVRLGAGVGLNALSSDDFRPLPGESSYSLSQVRPTLSTTLLVGYSFGRVTVFGDTGYYWTPLEEDDFIRALRVGPKLYILESMKAVPLGIGIRTRL